VLRPGRPASSSPGGITTAEKIRTGPDYLDKPLRELQHLQVLGIGLIGLGKHGSRYARHIVEDLTDAALVAVCRRNRTEGETLAAAHGCAFYDDYRDLVANPRVDAVVVAVPPMLHPAIVEAACRVGKPLLVEKPLATSLVAAQHIASLVSTSGVRAMVAHTLRFNSTVQTVRALLPEIGPLHAVYLSQRFEPSPLDWLDRRAESGGGIVLYTGVHSFDLLRFLTGCEVTRVWCRTVQIITRETEDSFAMTCQLSDSSLVATIAGSRAMGGRVGLIDLAGARGHLLADHVHGFVHLVRGTERLALPVPFPVPTVRETLGAFARALREGTSFPISIEDGLRAVAIVDAAYRSAECSGEGEAVGGFSGGL
jgi:predicted dehydrogenase